LALRFGIPSLDELLELRTEEESDIRSRANTKANKPRGRAKSKETEKTVESYAIVGADGSGKSVLALHLASRYHADCWALTKRAGEPRTPRILYVSSDLKSESANLVWKNFGLDKPNTRHVPFERISDMMKRYWIDPDPTNDTLDLRELRPSTERPSAKPTNTKPPNEKPPDSTSLIDLLASS